MRERNTTCFHALIIGAAKCGTTSLALWLGASPDVCLSQPKEPLFFEADFDRGIDYYWNTYFPHWRGEAVLLEARHRNMFLPYVPERVASVCRSPRMIAVLRDPVRRAYSHWWHHFIRGHEPLNFEEAIEEDMERISAGIDFSGPNGPTTWAAALPRTRDRLQQRGLTFRTYIDSGYYAAQIRRYLQFFHFEQLKVLFLEDLVAKPSEKLGSLAHFLTIDQHQHSLSNQNEAKTTSLRVGKVGRSLVYGRAAELLPRELRTFFRRALIREERNMPELTSAITQELYAHYEPHNHDLERLLDTRLPPQWYHHAD